jgi:hypothetical protein
MLMLLVVVEVATMDSSKSKVRIARSSAVCCVVINSTADNHQCFRYVAATHLHRHDDGLILSVYMSFC